MIYTFPQSLDVAIEIATTWHKGQTRNHSGLPYICHPFDVIHMLARWGVRGNKHPFVLEAGMLHDVIEDTHADQRAMVEQQIRWALGLEVATICAELTFIPMSQKDKAAEKAAYMASFEYKSIESLLTKLSDRFCNILDYIDSDFDYARSYAEKAAPLLQTAQHHRNDIKAKFGIDVVFRMIGTYEEICVKLGVTGVTLI